MAKETRSVKQYKTYTLLVQHEAESGLKSSVPVAVFDDRLIMDKYLKASEGIIEAENIVINEDWREIVPKAGNFGLAFNPKFDRKAHDAQFNKKLPKRAKNKTPVKVSVKVPESAPKLADDLEALKGVKITKKNQE